MRFRPFDENGDMVPIKESSQMWEGKEAVAGAIKSRINLTYGEWWEDEELGFMIPIYLFGDLRGENVGQMLANYVGAYIQQTEGVTSVDSADYDLDEMEDREISMEFIAHTEEGEDIEQEVTFDELLSAATD